MLLWAVLLRRIRIRTWMVLAVFAIEIPIRALLMASAGRFVAYMLLTNWIAVFLLGMARGADAGERPSATFTSATRSKGYAVALVAGLAVWGVAMQFLPFEPTFPFMSLAGWPTAASLAFVSASVSLLYLGTTVLLFAAIRHLETTPAPVAFIARNSLIIFLAHMPVYYLLQPVLAAWTTSYWTRVMIQLLVCLPVLALMSEGIVAGGPPRAAARAGLRMDQHARPPRRTGRGRHCATRHTPMKPRVDVIVPCYNYGDVLEACVNSVLTQHDVDVRVLVMDDASTDSTEEVGSRLAADPRVEYRRHAVNRGHIATYNEALALLTGDFCMVLSADDLLTPGALRRATRVMVAHPQVGFAYGPDITFRHAPPAASASTAAFCTHRIMGYFEFLERSCRLGHTPIQAPTVLVRTSLHREIGDYLLELPHTADTEIWLRMAANGTVCELHAPQAFRRLHAKNMSLDYSPVRRLAEQKKAFDIHFDQFRFSHPGDCRPSGGHDPHHRRTGVLERGPGVRQR